MRKKKEMDGNQAAAEAAYFFSDAALIYPITPSTPMAEYADEWAASGRKNMFGNTLLVRQLQSEAGAAAAMHGALLAGALSVTFTSSQGLLLMLPNLYKMAGERLPGVFHVAARSIASHALSIYGDHSDIYACRQTGAAMLCSSSVQEVMDLAPVAHIAALRGRMPVIHFFDGFRTSHEIQKIDVWGEEDLRALAADGDEIAQGLPECAQGLPECEDFKVFAGAGLNGDDGESEGKKVISLAKEEQSGYPEGNAGRKSCYTAWAEFRRNALTPDHGKEMGSAQEPDVFFQYREAVNKDYEEFPKIVQSCMDKINARIGTSYRLFEYYGAWDARHVIVAMGSVCSTIEETVDALNNMGKRTGLVKVRLYRPFFRESFVRAVPDSVEILSVLDRTKEPGAPGEPLYLDVLSAMKGNAMKEGALQENALQWNALQGNVLQGNSLQAQKKSVRIFHGRYGLSSKDTTPQQIAAVFLNEEKEEFTIGIKDDVTHLSLEPVNLFTENETSRSYKFWGLGGDGTVGANKNSVKLIGDFTPLYAQAYFSYDSKKSRGLTVSHIRISSEPIRSSYLIYRTDFAACHNPAYLHKYDIVQEIKDGGVFLLNCPYKGKELETWLPAGVKQYLAEHRIRFFVIDGMRIGKEIGLNGKINTILQAAFFKVCGILEEEEAVRRMKEYAEKAYLKKGRKIVEMNYRAIERGMQEVREIAVPERWKEAKRYQGELPEEWEEAKEYQTGMSEDWKYEVNRQGNGGAKEFEKSEREKLLEAIEKGTPDYIPENRVELRDFVADIQRPIARQRGNELPVSAFLPYRDGGVPSGTSAHERRNIASELPVWKPENCIQCSRCSFVCPHAVIRPYVLNEEERRNAPDGMQTIPMAGNDVGQYGFTIAISVTDCTGCGSCAAVCPGMQGRKALEMHPASEYAGRQDLVGNEKISRAQTSEYAGQQGPTGAENPLRSEVFGQVNRQDFFDYAKALPEKPDILAKFKKSTVKGSQFRKPYLEFHGACAGCGETPYARLVTQLFGECMYIANATGCSSIWGNSYPSTPYTVNEKGQGPAWANSLFEDAAEFGYGMMLAGKVREMQSLEKIECRSSFSGDLSIEDNLFGREQEKGSIEDSSAVCLDKDKPAGQEPKVLHNRKSYWIFGGDGWAYDIGFSGLDHILASGENVNILVFDTEVYSNTGGQASKATPKGAQARLAAGGKKTKKKNLAMMAMTYGTVYVAQVAMGADFQQTLKALIEAEQYDGPSLVIAYAPCISHGIKAGLGSAQHEEKKAVEAGYWNLFRYHPGNAAKGENPFMLDSPAPKRSYGDFLDGELRFGALRQKNAKIAGELAKEAAEDAEELYEAYQEMSE